MRDHTPSDESGRWFLNGRVTVRRSRDGAPDGLSILESEMARGDSPPLHVHRDEDEVFHILAGEIRFRVGEAEVLARSGDTLVAPKRTPHTFRVESETARFVTITTGDFEHAVRAFSRPADGPGLPAFIEPAPETVQALTRVMAAHGIDILGPPMAA
jgi:mannose-6-phosphate isomerase-like protein (cupin superfamily)